MHVSNNLENRGWGAGDFGQLGDNRAMSSDRPVHVRGEDLKRKKGPCLLTFVEFWMANVECFWNEKS